MIFHTVCLFFAPFFLVQDAYGTEIIGPVQGNQTTALAIEDRSIFDMITKITKITGDLGRSDIPSVCVHGLELVREVQLNWILSLAVTITYRCCKFIRPAYWFLIPSSKPSNVKGLGFSSIWN